METFIVVKNQFDWEMNECLHQIFFEENEKILNLKLQHQYEATTC